MEEVFKPHVTVATVVANEGRYLVVEEWVRGEKVINQPAGHLDPNESLVDAARREALEETAYEVAIDDLIGIYQWESSSGKQFLRFAFAGHIVGHEADRELDEGVIGALWLTREELRQRMHQIRSPMVLRNIDDYEAGVSLGLAAITNLNLGNGS